MKPGDKQLNSNHWWCVRAYVSERVFEWVRVAEQVNENSLVSE